MYRPHRQRFPVGNRLTLVALGFSGPPRLAAVWWISLLSSHLRLKNLLSAWPPFLIPEIGAAPCRPDVDVSLMCLAMKKRPAVVTWFLFANLGLTYYIQIKEKLSAPMSKFSGMGTVFLSNNAVDLLAFSTIICSVQLNVQGPGGSYEIPFHQRSIGEVGDLHPLHPDPLQKRAVSPTLL